KPTYPPNHTEFQQNLTSIPIGTSYQLFSSHVSEDEFKSYYIPLNSDLLAVRNNITEKHFDRLNDTFTNTSGDKITFIPSSIDSILENTIQYNIHNQLIAAS